MPVAFFDVDNTLLKGSTAAHSLSALHRYGLIRWRDVIASIRYGLLYKLRLLDEKKMFGVAVEVFTGRKVKDIQIAIHNAFYKKIRPNLYHEALELIRFHQSRGHKVVLLSGTSVLVLKHVARELNVDAAIGSEQKADPDTGRLLPAYYEPLCIGDGKVVLAERWLKENGLEEELLYFYSDAISDLPMLERADIPVACNPDVRLRSIALLRDWPVFDFESTRGRPRKVARG